MARPAVAGLEMAAEKMAARSRAAAEQEQSVAAAVAASAVLLQVEQAAVAAVVQPEELVVHYKAEPGLARLGAGRWDNHHIVVLDQPD